MDLEKYYAKPNETIQQHNDELLRCLNTLKKLGYIEEEALYKLCVEACKLHDLGKVNPEFQKRVQNTTRRVKFDDQKEVAHNVLSLCLIDPNNYGGDTIEYHRIAFAVAFHHNYCQVSEAIRDKKELINKLLEGVSEYVHYPKRSILNKMKNIQGDKMSILLKGFLHKCDYCASANAEGSTKYDVEIPNQFIEQSMEGLLQSWKTNIANSDWNDMQRYCMKQKDKNIMVVAQTGMGKTEGALHWIGNQKGFFVLPLKTAINAMYDRVAHDIIKQDIEHKLGIVHSESMEYLMGVENEENVIEHYKRGRKLSMPLTITTMDQLFDFVFKYSGYEMKLTTFSYSKIVIDEIQMYDAELLAYLLYGIKRICEIGGKVAIITATLAPFIKDELESLGFEYEQFIDESYRHNVKVIQEKMNVQDILQIYESNKSANKANKILVVCNTIKQAQKIYKEIIQEINEEDGNQIHILHARFTRKDRTELETEIVNVGKTYDKTGNLDIRNEIWISTSLVEASLDIDFDYLFTELQDINSLFQRMGRCNRKGKKDITTENCFVYTEIDANLISQGNNGFIDRKIYNLSKEALLDEKLHFSGPVTEKQKLELIQNYFTTKKIKGSEYYIKFKNTYQFIESLADYSLEKDELHLRDIQSIDIIPSEIYMKNKETYQDVLSALRNEEDYLERKKLQEIIKQDILSIPAYEYFISRKKGNVVAEVKVGYQKIIVLDCIYEQAGYERKDRTEDDRLATFW